MPVDIAAARQMFSFLFPKDILEFGAPVLKVFAGTNREASLWTTDDVLERLLRENACDHTGLGFGVAVRRVGFDTRGFSQGTKADCSAVYAIKVDFDSTDPVHGSCKMPLIDAVKSSVCEMLSNAPIAPSLVVDSGGGIHGYFRFDKPLLLDCPAAFDRYEQVNKDMIVYFQTQTAQRRIACVVDPTVKDIPRIMRLPGSINHKYGDHRPVKIIEVIHA